MATGKVRIFELAKELGMSSKELIALFERLGLEAKNQLSVVDDQIAGLLRAQLGKSAAPAAPKAAPQATPPPSPNQRLRLSRDPQSRRRRKSRSRSSSR